MEVRIPKIKMIMQRNAEEREEGHELSWVSQFAQTMVAKAEGGGGGHDAPGGMLGDEKKDGGERASERPNERERATEGWEEEETERAEEND